MYVRCILSTQFTFVFISNFNIIIIADDCSLWALGMGEHDRNMNNVPLRVQTDFHHADGTRRLVDLLPEDEVDTVYVDLPKDALLRKGYNRVSLVYPSERRNVGNNSTISATYDIVIHKDEAYLLELLIDSFSFTSPLLQGSQDYQIRDFSGGWQHSMLSLQTPSDTIL